MRTLPIISPLTGAVKVDKRAQFAEFRGKPCLGICMYITKAYIYVFNFKTRCRASYK